MKSIPRDTKDPSVKFDTLFKETKWWRFSKAWYWLPGVDKFAVDPLPIKKVPKSPIVSY